MNLVQRFADTAADGSQVVAECFPVVPKPNGVIEARVHPRAPTTET
jgi:hypothetical protein